ncbi:MAG: diguanylate cyclase [Anaeromyxobacter sp.]
MTADSADRSQRAPLPGAGAASGVAQPVDGMDILVADDSATIRALLRAALGRWGFRIHEVSDGEQAWRALQEDDAPSLALIDWEMPALTGLNLVRRIRANEALGGKRYTYIILLTARRSAADVVEGMDAGADDYVSKPFNPHELRVRLRAGRRVVELQAELYRMQEVLSRQTRTDPLTGCLNRRGITEQLAKETAKVRRQPGRFALGMIDIDHFKRVNDQHGHAAGDAVLRELVARVSRTIRSSDTVGRMGGEEFLVIWPGLDAEDAQRAAERLREAIAAAPFQIGEVELPVTISIGFGTTDGVEEPEALVNRADQSLYAAKSAGRNRVVGG